MDGPVELKFIFDDYGQSFEDDDPPIDFPIYVLRDGIYELVEMPRCLGEGDLEDICLENMDEESCIGACTWLEDQCADITIEDPNPSIDGDEQIAGIELIDNIDNK